MEIAMCAFPFSFSKVVVLLLLFFPVFMRVSVGVRVSSPSEICAGRTVRSSSSSSADPVQVKMQVPLYPRPPVGTASPKGSPNPTIFTVSYHYKAVDPAKMRCRSTCTTEGSSEPEGGVVQSVSELRELVKRLQSATTSTTSRLPWCGFAHSDPVSGVWVPRELWRELSLEKLEKEEKGENTPSPAAEVGLGERLLSKVMGGAVASALQWGHLWLPTNCRAFRYDASSFAKCVRGWQAREGHSLRVLLLGDGTTRGIFCSWARLLTPSSGEFCGVVRAPPCYGDSPVGTVIPAAEWAQTVHHPYSVEFSSDAHAHARLTFHYARDSDSWFVPLILDALLGKMPPTEHPHFIVYNSGSWDFFPIVHYTRKVESGSASRSRNRRQQYYRKSVQTIVDVHFDHHSHTSNSSSNSSNVGRNHTTVNHERPAKLRQTLKLLRDTYHFNGTMVYRSNPCNAEFDARAADQGVLRLLRQEFPPPFAVGLDVFGMSTCRGSELMRDSVNFDRMFSGFPPMQKPSLGELSAEIVQSLVNGICNSVLFPPIAQGTGA